MRKQRTTAQNDALHKLFDLLAEAFNDNNKDKVAVLKEKAIPVQWTGDAIKKEIWHPLQKALYPPDEGKKVSTRDLSTTQVTQVYDELNKWTAGKFGIHVPFPSEEER